MVKQNKHKKIITLANVSLSLAVVTIFLIICIAALGSITNDLNNECCKIHDAKYLFYECQCGLFSSCEKLKCGAYCQFDNGSMIQISKLRCEFNST